MSEMFGNKEAKPESLENIKASWQEFEKLTILM